LELKQEKKKSSDYFATRGKSSRGYFVIVSSLVHI